MGSKRTAGEYGICVVWENSVFWHETNGHTVQASMQASLFAQSTNKDITSMNNVQGQAARKAHKAQHCWPPCKKNLTKKQTNKHTCPAVRFEPISSDKHIKWTDHWRSTSPATVHVFLRVTMMTNCLRGVRQARRWRQRRSSEAPPSRPAASRRAVRQSVRRTSYPQRWRPTVNDATTVPCCCCCCCCHEFTGTHHYL